jgi:formamidopyrimidine-DNA glycosylase
MPELPEVEVTRLHLAPAWEGTRVLEVLTGPPSYFFLTEPRELARRLRRRVTRTLHRHGKYLLAELDDGSRLLCHLGMTGQLFTAPRARGEELKATDPHVHLVLVLQGGQARTSGSRTSGSRESAVVFRDPRKFGKVQWLEPGATSTRLDKMGPDALAIDARALHVALAQRSIPIKTALLDQGILAGVGNIYADEALFLARLHPTRPASSLGLEECQRLVTCLRRVLRAAIRAGGSTISDFLGADGAPGRYQQNHRVYGREQSPCPRCGAPVSRIVLGQRSAHFCPECQGGSDRGRARRGGR